MSPWIDRRRFLTGAGAVGALSLAARRAPAQEAAPESGAGRRCDLALKGATIVDGTGSPGFVGDVGISRDRIVAVGEVGEARETIDCTGLVICPGFVDLNTHLEGRCFSALRVHPLPPSDGAIPKHTAKMLLEQGVTTALSGNAGRSALDIEAHLESLETQGTPVNYATLVGHASLLEAVGAEGDVASALQAALAAGAYGLSVDLESGPSAATPLERLAGLARLVGSADRALLAVRRRSSGAEAVDATAEALTLGRISGAKVHLSRFRATFDAGWANSAAALDMVEAAIESGLDVSADCYAHPGCGLSVAEAYIPPDLRPPVHREALRDKIGSAELLAHIAQQLGVVDPSVFYPRTSAWEGVYDMTVAEVARTRRALNLLDFVAELALADVGVLTGAEIPTMGVYMAEMLLPELHDTLGRGFVAIASDASAPPAAADTKYLFPWSYANTVRALTTFVKQEAPPPEAPTTQVKEPTQDPTPAAGEEDEDRPRRGGGSRVRAEHETAPVGLDAPTPLPQPDESRAPDEPVEEVSDEQAEIEAAPQATLAFETVVHRLTGLPASRLGLPDRGIVKAGAFADLVVLDRRRLSDRSAPTYPSVRPAGIVRVLLNGRIVVEDGEYNGELAGAVLRR